VTRNLLIPVIIEKTRNCFNASSPKVPGCVATDKTVEKVLARYAKAVALHLKNDKRAKDKLSRARRHVSLSPYIKEYGTKSFYTFLEVKLKG
jgi:predicted RNase H-like HicB family nuclease